MGCRAGPGDLISDKMVEGHVLVDRANHGVAIAVGFFVGMVLLVGAAVAFAKAGDVEPVASPSFAEVRAVQQLIDKLLVGFGRPVFDE